VNTVQNITPGMFELNTQVCITVKQNYNNLPYLKKYFNDFTEFEFIFKISL